MVVCYLINLNIYEMHVQSIENKSSLIEFGFW